MGFPYEKLYFSFFYFWETVRFLNQIFLILTQLILNISIAFKNKLTITLHEISTETYKKNLNEEYTVGLKYHEYIFQSKFFKNTWQMKKRLRRIYILQPKSMLFIIVSLLCFLAYFMNLVSLVEFTLSCSTFLQLYQPLKVSVN